MGRQPWRRPADAFPAETVPVRIKHRLAGPNGEEALTIERSPAIPEAQGGTGFEDIPCGTSWRGVRRPCREQRAYRPSRRFLIRRATLYFSPGRP